MAIMGVGSPWLWGGFIGFVLVMLALDLGVFHRKAHTVRFKEAMTWSVVWIAMALLFNLGVWWKFGSGPALEFLTGYLIEKSLSIDNVFVFVVIFSSLAIPELYRHRVLFYGILSALVLRAGMIFAGAAMLERFHWLIYVFGAFLVLTGIKLFIQWKRHKPQQEATGFSWVKRLIPSTDRLDGGRFLTLENGKWVATPLLVALLLVEVTDVVFALDSIPAIFAVTEDPFLVFSSNIFAILGLRSLFFVLAGMMDRFHYLKPGLASVLGFVGMKMMVTPVLKIPSAVSLGMIALLLGTSVVASLLRTRGLERAARLEGERQPGHT